MYVCMCVFISVTALDFKKTFLKSKIKTSRNLKKDQSPKKAEERKRSPWHLPQQQNRTAAPSAACEGLSKAETIQDGWRESQSIWGQDTLTSQGSNPWPLETSTCFPFWKWSCSISALQSKWSGTEVSWERLKVPRLVRSTMRGSEPVRLEGEAGEGLVARDQLCVKLYAEKTRCPELPCFIGFHHLSHPVTYLKRGKWGL